jgi:hypothetical protein
VSELVSEDNDLEYPQVVYRGTGRHREEIATLDQGQSFRDWKREYLNDKIEAESEYYLENIGEHFDEEELASMSDAEKEAWAQQQAEYSVGEEASELDVETNYEADAYNYDDIYEYWDERVRDNPGDYGIEGTSSEEAPAYGQYTVGREGNDADANYTVSAGRLIAEERFGRGNRAEPEFLKPYLHAAEQPELLGSPDQMALFAPSQADTPQSKAFQIEALRRTKRDADPMQDKYRAEVDKSHYDELGQNQMYFTRETDRDAPDWGSVKEGIGRVPGSTLKDPAGNALPQRSDTSRPMRLVDEAQSDWLQAGRKTEWADPKGYAKIAKEDADIEAAAASEKARVEAFQQQALDELPNALEDDRIKTFINNMREQVARASEEGSDVEMPYYADRTEETLRRFQEMNGRNRAAYSMEDRMDAARQFFRNVYNAEPSGTPTEAFASQITDSLDNLPTMTSAPRGRDPTPSSPMRETRQYNQLAMADALRRAVQEGQQYLAWTPGDVHLKRWGTDTFQYAPSPENPRVFRYKSDDTSTDKDTGKTGLENLQASADELLDNAGNSDTLNLDDPGIDEKLLRIVKSNLNYGMDQYRRPDVAQKKRAALLKKELEAASKSAQAGERKAAHYSPRGLGYDLAYEPTADDVIAVLRRAGVKKLPEIRDIPNPDSPKPLRGFEIDPEVAQAAKRGLPLPY